MSSSSLALSLLCGVVVVIVIINFSFIVINIPIVNVFIMGYVALCLGCYMECYCAIIVNETIIASLAEG